MEQPGSTTRLDEAAEVARQYGHHAARDVYAGLRVDQEAGVLTLYRVPTHSFDDEVRTLIGEDVTVEIVDAPHTRSELSIAREVAWSLTGDFTIESVVIPDDGSRLRVFVTGSEWDAQRQLDELVPGTADVMVSRRDRLSAPVYAGRERRGQST
jgi:hypothetical protein